MGDKYFTPYPTYRLSIFINSTTSCFHFIGDLIGYLYGHFIFCLVLDIQNNTKNDVLYHWVQVVNIVFPVHSTTDVYLP